MSTTSLIIVLLIASSSLALENHKSVFDKEIKIPRGSQPLKWNNELKLFDSNKLISLTPGYDDCTLNNFDPSFYRPNGDTIYTLGNGKLLIKRPTKFPEYKLQVLEFHNCSYVSTLTLNVTSHFDKLELIPSWKSPIVVTYNDTFDVFDWHQKTCMPCRHNDKGERLTVEFSLTKEPTGVDPQDFPQHNGFSLDLIEDDFGVKNGYFYMFRYRNETTAIRILDSQFKVVKQRLFPAQIKAHSTSHGNITICYTKDPCNYEYGHCEYAECHSLNADLNSTAEWKLHQFSNDNIQLIKAQLRVKNLIGGEAMAAMEVSFHRFGTKVYHHEIFLQRIRSDGRVDEPIKFDSMDNFYVIMDDFTFDNGEYCLVTSNYYNKKGVYTLIKCLKTSI